MNNYYSKYKKETGLFKYEVVSAEMCREVLVFINENATEDGKLLLEKEKHFDAAFIFMYGTSNQYFNTISFEKSTGISGLFSYRTICNFRHNLIWHDGYKFTGDYSQLSPMDLLLISMAGVGDIVCTDNCDTLGLTNSYWTKHNPEVKLPVWDKFRWGLPHFPRVDPNGMLP